MAEIDWEQYKAPQQNSNASEQDWEQFRVSPKPLSSNIVGRIPHALGEVAKDVGSAALALPEKVVHGLLNLPKDYRYLKENIPQAAHQIINDPARAARGAMSGLADIGHMELNAPSDVANYMGKIGLISPETANQIPRQKDINSQLSQFVGGNQQPGDELIRNAISHIPQALAVGRVASALNPMQLTSRNIARDIMNTRNANREAYSGPHGHYNQLFNEATRRGINQVPINPAQIDIGTISQHAGDRYLHSVNEVLQNPTLEHSQRAVSDLGKLARSLEKRETLTSSERDTLNAARNARDHISNQMFRDNQGNLHQDLLDRHRQIQQGYRENVVPYTTDKNINAFQRNELSAKQLIKRLENSKFNVQRGNVHPNINRQKLAKDIFTPIGKYGAMGAAGYGAYSLLNRLLGGSSRDTGY